MPSLRRVESGAVDFGGRILVHPPGEIADAQAAHGSGRIEVELAGNAVQVAGVRTGNAIEHEQGVFNAARHGTELVEGPAKSHGAGARNAAVGGAQASDAAAHAGADDAAAGFAADGEGDETCSRGSAGAGARTGRTFFEIPGIHRLTAKPDVVERERAHAELGDQHRAGLVETLDHRGILLGDAVAERLSAVSRGNARGVEEIFCAPGNAVQRAAIVAGGDFRVGAAGLLERHARA